MQRFDNPSLLQSTSESGEESDVPVMLLPIEAQIKSNTMNEIAYNTLSHKNEILGPPPSLTTITLTVIGGILIMMCIGVFGIWGAMSIYVASYFKQSNPNVYTLLKLTLSSSAPQPIFPSALIMLPALPTIVKKASSLIASRSNPKYL